MTVARPLAAVGEPTPADLLITTMEQKWNALSTESPLNEESRGSRSDYRILMEKATTAYWNLMGTGIPESSMEVRGKFELGEASMDSERGRAFSYEFIDAAILRDGPRMLELLGMSTLKTWSQYKDKPQLLLELQQKRQEMLRSHGYEFPE